MVATRRAAAHGVGQAQTADWCVTNCVTFRLVGGCHGYEGRCDAEGARTEPMRAGKG